VRVLKKHRVALIALAVYHFVLFFPTLFMGRIASPNDVFYNFEPWKSVRQVSAQNSLINDPPTAYYTVLSLIKTDWRAFHWNPFIGSGVPGFGSTLLAPFSFFPALLLPLPWIYTGIILLKLNVAFWLAYLWLREERLGKRGAAIGAILFAAAGPIAVRWWWHVTNAAPLYPALLWIALRTARGKRTPAWAIGSIALCYALSAFPATMAYGAYAAVAYFVYLAIRERRFAPRVFATTAFATLLGIMIAAPSFIPLAQLVGRTGYLGSRANAAAEHVFPLRHFALFANPDHLGNIALRDWRGDRALGTLNNYIEATVYVGIVALPLIFLAIANRRARSRRFWLAMLAIMLAAMFGMPVIATIAGSLPGFKYLPSPTSPPPAPHFSRAAGFESPSPSFSPLARRAISRSSPDASIRISIRAWHRRRAARRSRFSSRSRSHFGSLRSSITSGRTAPSCTGSKTCAAIFRRRPVIEDCWNGSIRVPCSPRRRSSISTASSSTLTIRWYRCSAFATCSSSGRSTSSSGRSSRTPKRR
jgi:hypothetical protein